MEATRQKFESMLYQNGISEKDAESIMDCVIQKFDAEDSYKVTWDRPSNEYENPFYAVMFLTMKPYVLEWIDENKPLAFYRRMFE